jgi:ferredoxin-NADP reductase
VTDLSANENEAGPWQMATVVDVRVETPTAKTFRLQLPEPPTFRAGQHYIIRLTAPDGYTASRSYSVASPPDDSRDIELTVELLPGGEVSMFLHEVVMPGDQLEVRGPIGGWFVWDGDSPALLIGGGSGVVPLMSMLRLARNRGNSDLLRVVVSVRTPEMLYYQNELPGPETSVVYTRTTPPSFVRPAGRLTEADLPACPPESLVYICGSPGFADAASELVLQHGVPVERVRIERFGPSG